LVSIGGEDSVDVRFRYWEKGNKVNTYTRTTFQSVGSSPKTYSESVSGLDSGTTYVFVAEVETADGENDFGSKLEFTTT
jgi:subtilisin